MSKMRIVNIVCILGCMLIYLLIGSGGYVLLGQNTPDDILKGICGDGAYFNRSGAHNDGCCMADNATHNATHNGTHPNYLNEHFGNEGYHDNYYGGVGYGNKTPSPPDDTMCSSHLMVTVALARFCVLIKVACSFGMIVFVVRVVSFSETVRRAGHRAAHSTVEYVSSFTPPIDAPRALTTLHFREKKRHSLRGVRLVLFWYHSNLLSTESFLISPLSNLNAVWTERVFER